MRRFGRSENGWTLGVARGANEHAAPALHAPATVDSLDGQMRDRHARRPILRLNQQRRSNERVRHLTMGMAVEQQIDAGDFVRYPCRDVLAANGGAHRVVARWLVETR